MSSIRLPEMWNEVFGESSTEDLFSRVEKEYEEGVIYPPRENVFAAFEKTAISDVKVVILGQDPYHEEGQAMGVAFAVPKGTKMPPSLRNIKKEIEAEFGSFDDFDTTLDHWCRQGVLLLNTTLTVRAGEAMSMAGIGWEEFTDDILRYLNAIDRPIVYMLWGNHARKKKAFLNNKKQLVLEAAHPSPLSASRGFFGCEHFKKCNEYLKENGSTEIEWK